MNLKKIAAAGLSVVVLAGLAGCGGQDKAADKKAGSDLSGKVTASGSSALLPLAKMHLPNSRRKIRTSP